jgi:hypothetical protein
VTLTSSAASVSFTGISAAGKGDLVLVVSNLSLAAGPADIAIRINGDSGTNYSLVRMTGNGSTTQSQAFSANWCYIGVGTRATTSPNYQSIVQFMDYSATDKHKSILSRTNNSSNGTEAIANRWANTSAITSFVLQEVNGILIQSGSTFHLYQIVSE